MQLLRRPTPHLRISTLFRPARHLQLQRRMLVPKRVVYVLRTASDPSRYYTGVTSDPQTRLDAHNAGKCAHTAGKGPWVLDVMVEFTDAARALRFERYLKSGSGVVFAHRHLR